MSLLTQMAVADRAAENPVMKCLKSSYMAFDIGLFGLIDDKYGSEVGEQELVALVKASVAELLATDTGAERIPARFRHDLTAPEALSLVRQLWLNEAPEGETAANWLQKRIGGDGSTIYRVTSDASRAVELVKGLGSDYAGAGGTEMEGVFSAMSGLLMAVSPTSELARRATEDALKRAQEAYDIAHSDEAAEADPVTVGDRAVYFQTLLESVDEALPRVQEAIEARAERNAELLRSGKVPVGQLMAEETGANARIFSSSDEMRRAREVISMLEDPDLYERFADGFSEVISSEPMRRQPKELRASLVASFESWKRHHAQILDASAAAARPIANAAAANLDNARGRGYLERLRELQGRLMSFGKGRSRTDDSFVTVWAVGDEAGAVEIATPKDRTRAPAPALATYGEADARFGLTQGDLEALGAPKTRDVLEKCLDSGAATLSEAFNALPRRLRRPCEVPGLLELIDRCAVDDALDRRARYVTWEDDGTARAHLFPEIPIDDDNRKEIERYVDSLR